MFTSTTNPDLAGIAAEAGDVQIPLIRAGATISFAVAPCSAGFVIIAVSEHSIRSIIVGDDPEMLMSDLQNQFPNDVFAIMENDGGLVAKILQSIECADPTIKLPCPCPLRSGMLLSEFGRLD